MNALIPKVINGRIVITNKNDYDEVHITVNEMEDVLNNVYHKGRADQKKEDNEFFNFEGAWELEKQKIRADAIEEQEDIRAEILCEICKRYHIALIDMNMLVDDVLEQLKGQEMKAIFSKCYDDWGNLKDNALNIAFNLGKKEGLRIGRKQGRADAEAEHKAMCETCIHKVSAEDIKQIEIELLDNVMQKHRTIITEDGVMYKVVFLKDIEDMRAEVRNNEY